MRTLAPTMLIAGLALLSAPGSAEVVEAADDGFTLTRSIDVKASPARAYLGLGEIANWWSGEHSYSGDSANLSLTLRAGGCFCERLPKDKGSVEHGRVIMAWPGKLLRISAALGPLQQEAVSAVLSWEIKPKGSGSTVTMSYRVGGHVKGGLIPLSKPVDFVLGQQADRLKSWLDR